MNIQDIRLDLALATTSAEKLAAWATKYGEEILNTAEDVRAEENDQLACQLEQAEESASDIAREARDLGERIEEKLNSIKDGTLDSDDGLKLIRALAEDLQDLRS